MEVVKLKLRARITELEDEVRRTRVALDEQNSNKTASVEDDVSLQALGIYLSQLHVGNCFLLHVFHPKTC